MASIIIDWRDSKLSKFKSGQILSESFSCRCRNQLVKLPSARKGLGLVRFWTKVQLLQYAPSNELLTELPLIKVITSPQSCPHLFLNDTYISSPKQWEQFWNGDAVCAILSTTLRHLLIWMWFQATIQYFLNISYHSRTKKILNFLSRSRAQFAVENTPFRMLIYFLS
jgi:hypothetical protein